MISGKLSNAVEISSRCVGYLTIKSRSARRRRRRSGFLVLTAGVVCGTRPGYALSLHSRRGEIISSVTALPERLKQGSAVITAWCGIPEPAIAGVLAREAYDAVTLDMQHGLYDLASVARAIPLVEAAGKPAVARIPVGEFQTASKLLDAGASGIIAPMINTVEDASRFVSFMKFPPVGERSWGPARALGLTGLTAEEYLRRANFETLTFAMIETRAALANLEAILATDGIDGVFVGPSDLSITLSGGQALDPHAREVDEASEAIAAAAQKAGKIAGAYTGSPERAKQQGARGFRFLAVGSDAAFLRAGTQAALKGLRAD